MAALLQSVLAAIMFSEPSVPLELPPKGSIVYTIRQSCNLARTSANILLHQGSVPRLLKSPLFLKTYKTLSESHGVAMPLQFPSVAAEVNLITLLSILNFGHAYRVPLKEATGRGAYDTMRAFIFGLYLSSSDGDDLLSAEGLKGLTRGRVADLMQLTGHLHVEKAHPTIPGLTVGELRGPLNELVNEVTRVLNETGSILLAKGYSYLGDFVLDALNKGQISQGEPVDPEVVLDEVIRSFPAFQDVGEYNGKKIYLFKKALFMLHALVVRFGNQTPPKIPLPDTTRLPIFSDNVIPSMLVHFGILDLRAAVPPKLQDAFGALTVTENLGYVPMDDGTRNNGTGRVVEKLAEGPELSQDEAYVLRAAAVDACEMIVQEAAVLEAEGPDEEVFKSVNLPGLDEWLWSVAKEGRFRGGLSRFRQAGICIMY